MSAVDGSMALETAPAPKAHVKNALSDSKPGERTVDEPGVREWCIVCLGLVSTFLFSGLIFGWAPLQVLLEEDGVYRSRCSIEQPLCTDRSSRMVFLYTMGQMAAVFGGAPLGFLVDRCGPQLCSFIAAVCVPAGLLLLSIAEDTTDSADVFDVFLVAVIVVGFGGCSLLVACMKLPFLVAPRHLPFVMTACNCLFDASSVIFLGLYRLYASSGLGRREIFAGYSCLAFFLCSALALSWTGRPNSRLRAVSRAESARPSEGPGVSAKPRLHGLPFARQLRSFEAAFALTFLALQLFRSNSYLGTNKDLLTMLGDAKTGNTFAQIFAASLPASTIFVPLISCILRRGGFFYTIMLTNTLGVVWNVVALVPSLQLQVVAFAAFTNFRALLYSAYFTYLAHTFGSRTSGSMHAVLVSGAAVFSFLIWPCADFSRRQFGSLTPMYIVLLVLSIPVLVMTVLLARRLKLDPDADCREIRSSRHQTSLDSCEAAKREAARDAPSDIIVLEVESESVVDTSKSSSTALPEGSCSF